jgi:hypothetical protein
MISIGRWAHPSTICIAPMKNQSPTGKKDVTKRAKGSDCVFNFD